MPRFSDCFEEELDENTYAFAFSQVRPVCDRETLVGMVADVLTQAKSDPEVTADLLEAAGWTTAVADLRQGRPTVQRGDFAEALAAEACQQIDGSLVPIRKLRYQIDPNQTLPGEDVIAFVTDESDKIKALEFVEVKYRTRPSSDIAVTAHEQLAAARELDFATTINFLANRLKESDSVLYKTFMAFLREREVQDSRHTVVLSLEASNWSDAIAENLDDLDEHLPKLKFRIFPFENSVTLIDEIYDKVLLDATEDD